MYYLRSCSRTVVFPICYTATIMPYEIFFVGDNTELAWYALEIALTIAFSLDMICCFNFAYHDEHGHPVSDRCGGNCTRRGKPLGCRAPGCAAVTVTRLEMAPISVSPSGRTRPGVALGACS